MGPSWLWFVVGAYGQEPAPPPAPAPQLGVDVPTDVPEGTVPAPEQLPDPVPPAASPEDLLHLARERLRHGDYDGVHLLVRQALDRPGDHQRQAQYVDAMAFEWGGDPEQALAIYDALIAASPPGEVSDDVRFRRAECLGRLQRYDEARAELDRLPRVDRPALDQLKIDVLTGIWELELGKDRRGYRRLTRALDAAAPDVGTYYQAVARHAILVRALDAADLLVFDGSDGAKKRALVQRAELIEAATTELAAIIRCEETALALDGFLRLGRAHTTLGEDLLDESPLVKLTPTQQALNRQVLEDRVSGVWVKANLYADRGMELAAKMNWTSEPVATLVAEKDAVIARVDALAGRGASEAQAP